MAALTSPSLSALNAIRVKVIIGFSRCGCRRFGNRTIRLNARLCLFTNQQPVTTQRRDYLLKICCIYRKLPNQFVRKGPSGTRFMYIYQI